jgi:hypothetical protein
VKHDRRWVEPATLLALVCLALVLTTVDQGGEFFRDEDHDLTFRSMLYAFAFEPLPSALPWWVALKERIANVAYHSVFFRHGAFPFFLGGGTYAVLERLGVPFGYATLQLPNALLGVATVGIFYRLLRRERIDIRVAALCTGLLIVSPIYLAQARGIATFMWTGIAFLQIFFLWSMQGLDATPRRQWPMALAIVLLLMGDAIFYLFLLAAFVAFALRDSRFPPKVAHLSWKALSAGFAPLRSWIILVPLTLGVGVHAWAYTRWAFLGHTVPPPLLSAIHKRSDFYYQFPDPGDILDAMTVLLGEGGLVLLALAPIAFVLYGRGPKGALFPFAVIGGLGYITLFYVITPLGWGKVHHHQIYVLVPVLSFIALAFDRIVKDAKFGAARATALLAVGVAVSAGSAATYIFKLPLAINQPALASVSFGSKRPTYGVKAAGFLVREYILQALKNGDATSFNMTVYEPATAPVDPDRSAHGFRIYHAPVRQYAAVLDGGAFFAAKRGIRPEFRVSILDREAPTPGAAAPAAVLPDCPTTFCVAVSPGETGTVMRETYTILVKGNPRGTVFLPSAKVGHVAAEAHEATALGDVFDRKYTKRSDYFANPFAKW